KLHARRSTRRSIVAPLTASASFPKRGGPMRIRIPIARCRLRPRLQIATRPVAFAAVRAPWTVGLLVVALVTGACAGTARDVTVVGPPRTTATGAPATSGPARPSNSTPALGPGSTVTTGPPGPLD